MASIYIMLCLHFAGFFRVNLQEPHLLPLCCVNLRSLVRHLKQWCVCETSFIQVVPSRVLRGSCGFSRAAALTPAAACRAYSPLAQPPHPALSGGGPAILEAFPAAFFPLGNVARDAGEELGIFASFYFPGLSQTREGRANNVFLESRRERLTAYPPSFPAGVPAMFLEHKMATRGLNTSPARNWGRPETSRTRPFLCIPATRVS